MSYLLGSYFLYIFASVKEKTRTSIFASLLLAVFLPMVIISSVHVHDDYSIADNDLCVKCVKHIPHATHFAKHISKQELCLFCHFLSLLFVAASLATFFSYRKQLTSFIAAPCKLMPKVALSQKSTRAPPFV